MRLKFDIQPEKETKGAVRYAERDAAEGGDLVVGTLYIRKVHLPKDGAPRTLTVEIRELG